MPYKTHNTSTNINWQTDLTRQAATQIHAAGALLVRLQPEHDCRCDLVVGVTSAGLLADFDNMDAIPAALKGNTVLYSQT